MSNPIVLLHRASGAPMDTAFTHTSLGAQDPFDMVREIGWRDVTLAVGRLSLDHTVIVESHPHTEALVVVGGTLTVTEQGGQSVTLAANDGIVIGRGTALTFDPGPGARLVFCAAPGAGDPQPGLARLRADADFTPAPSLPAELLIGPPGTARKENVFTDPATRFRAGVFDCTAVERIARAHLVHEFMHIIDGTVRLPIEGGETVVAASGDSLFVPKGSRIAWANTDRVAKFYGAQEA